MFGSRTFRLFLSSTFSDLVFERDKLQIEVYPRLRAYCASKGFTFQVVDLRWGVSEKDGWDHRTLDICLDQVKYCKDFLKPHFAIMLSERYGWIPLPNRIIRSDFEIIYSHFTEQSTRVLFDKWYRLDKNTDYYYLQTLTEETRDEWKLAEPELLKAFQVAVKLPEVRYELGAQKAEIYFKSATEQEIIEGLFNNHEVAIANIHTFYRRLFDSTAIDFTGLTPAGVDDLSRYCDLIDGKLDNDKHDKCIALVEQITAKYQKANLSKNMHKYDDLIIQDGDYSEIAAKIDNHEEYLTKFCADFEKSIQAAIDHEIKNSSQQINDLEENIQAKFLTDRTDDKSVFAERVIEMNIIESYIHNDGSRHPLVLIGESGSGKSSLMAQAIKRLETQSKSCVLYRFVGISERSSTDYQLVRSLNNQIKQYIQQNNPELKLQFGKLKSERLLENNYDGLCEIFIKRVEALSEFKKVVVFIDALDQLILDSSLEFIPLICNKNLKFIVSTLPDIDAKYVKLFKLRIMKENQEQYLVRIGLLNRKQMTDAYDQFNQINQIIQKTTSQKEFILHSSGKAPLNFKIMLESSKAWRSYDELEFPQELNSFKSDNVIGYFFKSLPHEAQLIQLTVGLLSASREGLIENDLLDMLSRQLNNDQELYNKVINDIYKNKPERIPDSIWLRINADLSPYLTHKSLNGVVKLSLFHRSFNQVALQYAEQNKVQVRDMLIDYYQGIIKHPFELDNQQQHLNAYRELNYQYSQAGKFEQAFDLLMKQDFIYLLAKTNDVSQLIGEYHYAYRAYIKIIQRASLMSKNPEFLEPQNYVKFRNFYSWLFNAESVIENRNKIMSLWAALSQLGRDNDLALIPAYEEIPEYYCEQESKLTIRYEKVFTRLDDISHIVGVFNLNVNYMDTYDINEKIDLMVVITRFGYIYMKENSQNNFNLLEDNLGLLNGAIQNSDRIIIWNNSTLSLFTIEAEYSSEGLIYFISYDETIEYSDIKHVLNNFLFYIIIDNNDCVRFINKNKMELEKLTNTCDNNNQYIYNKNLFLVKDRIYNFLNGKDVGEVPHIYQWYQSPYALDLILGWSGKVIYRIYLDGLNLIQSLYTVHKSKITAIFGLRNYRYLSLAQDGELHYWNSRGESLWVFKSNYFHDILGVTEFGDNIIVIWNQRGYAVQIDLDLFSEAPDLIKNSQSVMAPALNEMEYEVNLADNDITLHNDFKTWCEVENFTPDITSCHSIDQEEFSFIDTRNNQVVFVTSCQILGVTRYVINNIWICMGKINQVINNDETQAELLVNAEYVRVIKHYSRKIVQSPISQMIYATTNPAELANKPAFIELLQENDPNQQDEFGFTPICYGLNSTNQKLVELLIANGAQSHQQLDSNFTPLLLVIQHGNVDLLNLLSSQFYANMNVINNDGYNPLMLAIQNGHEEIVSKLLEFNATVNVINNDGNTPLMLAIQSGHEEIVSKLLEFNATVNVINNDGNTPLMLAIQNGHEEIVSKLLEFNATVNVINNGGYTPLMLASKNGYIEIVIQLLKYNANINISLNVHGKYNGWTSLMFASKGGFIEVICLLLNDKEIIDFDTYDQALILASQNGHKEVVTKLIKANANVKSLCKRYKWTPLMHASYYGHFEVVKELVEQYLEKRHFEEINVINNGRNALILAVENGNYEVVKYLLELGADKNIQIEDGHTLLIIASYYGHDDIVSKLLEFKSCVDIRNNNGHTSLMFASQNGHSDVVARLIAANAEVDTKNNNGVTALMIASQYGHSGVVSQLLDAEANVNIYNNEGVAALLAAIDKGYSEIVNKLILADADIYTSGEQYHGCTPLMFAIKKGNSDITAKLLSFGIDLDAQDDDGWTAFHYAIHYGNTEIFNQLLNNRALADDICLLIAISKNSNREIIAKLIDLHLDVDIQDKNSGDTPLIRACENGNKNVVKQLIHARASVDIKNYFGYTSLMLASQNGHGEVVVQLLAAKADVDATDYYGVTSLMLATRNKHTEVVKILVDAEANINIQAKAENDCIHTLFIEGGVNITTYSALTIACLYGFSDIVNLLVLAKNIDLDSRDSNGDTPLICAIKFRNHEFIGELIMILICAGADIEAKDALGCTPLILASQNNYYDYHNEVDIISEGVEPHVVSQLLNAKAKVSVQDISGRNALMYACERNCRMNVFELLKYTDLPDIRDRSGVTALMLASQNGHIDVVSQLLAIGANPEIADNSGMTALMFAVQSGHLEVVELLNKYMRK